MNPLELLEAALWYSRRAIPVFPLHSVIDGQCSCGDPKCERQGKHPRTRHGFKDATTDESKIREWWGIWPNANIGIPTGKMSGRVVIDIDPRHGGDSTLAELELQHGALPDTQEQLTGGGGRHIIFKHPGNGIVIRNSAGKIGEGIDVRGDGGYVVGAPSLHVSGERYQIEASSHPDDVPLAAIPEWLLTKMQEPENAKATDQADVPITSGKRNNYLTKLAGAMRRKEAVGNEIEAALLLVNARRCKPPLGAAEIRKLSLGMERYSTKDETYTARPSFPVDVLPFPLQQFVKEAAASFPCPPDFVALILLVLLGAAIGMTRVLEVKRNWRETARIWCAFVAEPGAMKTPVFRLLNAWMHRRQAKAFREYEAAQEKYQQDLLEYEAAVQQWKADRKKDKPSANTSPPMKPEEPVLEQYYVDDITMEALAKTLSENPRGVVHSTDELASFYMSIGQYKKHGGADRKRFLSIWSGISIKVDRVSRKPLYVPCPFMSVIGGIQPDALKDLDPEAGMQDGFIHRILLVEPESVNITFTATEISKGAETAVDELFDALYALFPQSTDTERHTFTPVALPFSSEGLKRWTEWYNQHCEESQGTDLPPVLRGPWAKLRGYSVSLSLILACAHNPGAKEVDEVAVLGSITLIEEYFKPHLRYIYPQMLRAKATPFDRCREAVLGALRSRPLTYRSLRQSIGGRYPGDIVRQVLDDLKDAEEVGERPKTNAKAGTTELYITEIKADGR